MRNYCSSYLIKLKKVESCVSFFTFYMVFLIYIIEADKNTIGYHVFLVSYKDLTKSYSLMVPHCQSIQ